MSRIKLCLDCLGHNELKDYLTGINGISSVEYSNDDFVRLDISYDEKIINLSAILGEVYLFVNNKFSSMLSFDKCYEGKLNHMNYVIEDGCCDYCIMGYIESLFEIAGIEKVETDFDGTSVYNVNLNIWYSSVISSDKIAKLLNKICNN